MSKTVKKVAKIVGIAALAVTGIGLFVAPAALGVLAGVSAAANAIGLTTLFSIGAAALSIGTLPGKPKRIEDTGADQRGRAFLDPNALAAFAFGRTTVPCALVFEQRHADNQTVTNVVAHTWHRIESYVSLHANGERISFSGDDATGDWAGLLTWRRALGTQSSALNLTGTDWPNDAVGEGVAYSALTWRYRENSEKLRGGIPLNLDVVVEGAWLYDPRLDNEYGSGSQDFDDPSSWSFNDGNAALVLLRMLIGEYDGNGRLVWGRGAQESEIDMASFVAMANVADETVDDKPRYRLGGIHLLSGNWAEFVRRWEEETGGKLYKASGLYKVWLPHDDLTSLTTITEDDLLASEEIKLAIGNLSGMYNCARGRYIEPEEGYRAFPYPEVEEGTAISDDGMRRVLYHDFAWVQDVEIAERTARQLVRRSRFPRVWGVTLGWKGLDPKYEPFTVHTLNISETGNNNQLVRVIDRSISFDGRVRLLLQQEDESIYDDTVPLGDPFQSLGVSDRLDRIETVAPRYIDGTLIDALRPAGPNADNTAENLISVRITSNRGTLVFKQAPDGGDWTPPQTTMDVTFTFRKNGETIATHVVRVTRDDDELTAATQGTPSGDDTSVNIEGNGTGNVLITVTHDDSEVEGSANVIIVQGGSQGEQGDAGAQSARVLIYRRSSTTPVLPSSTATYTFADGSISGLNNSWTATIPAGTAPLWVSAATAFGTGATDTIAPTDWASPVVLVENGSDGVNTATVYLFQRNSTGAPPSAPSGTLTYTFSTATLSGNLEGWSQSAPNQSEGRFLWVTTATAVGTGSTDTITSGEWAQVQLLSQDGQDSFGGNLFPDPLNRTATMGQNGWSVEGGVTVATGTGFVGFAERSIAIHGGQASTGGVLTPHFPVEAGMFYRVGGWCGALNDAGQTTNCETTLYIRWYSDNDAEDLISGTEVGSTTATHSMLTAPTIDNIVAAPAGARRARLFQERTGNPNTDASISDGFFVLRAVDPKLIIDGAILARHLAALLVYAGEIVIDADGNIRSGATTYDGDGGWYIGRDGGEPALSMRAGDDFIRMKPSTGLETSFEEAGSFTGTLTGFISNPSETFQWRRTGDKVTITLEAIGGVSGNSNSTGMSLTGLPTAIRPATDQFVFCAGIVNNSVQNLIGICQVSSSGSVTISPLEDSNLVGQVGRAFFANTGTKGLNRYWSITYSLD